MRRATAALHQSNIWLRHAARWLEPTPCHRSARDSTRPLHVFLESGNGEPLHLPLKAPPSTCMKMIECVLRDKNIHQRCFQKSSEKPSAPKGPKKKFGVFFPWVSKEAILPGMSQEFCQDVLDPWGCSKSYHWTNNYYIASHYFPELFMSDVM